MGREIVYRVKHQLLVSPQVEVVPYGSLPRSERKSKRVFDTRLSGPVVEGLEENS